MTESEVLSELLAGISDEYNKAAGSFFYDILAPVAYELKKRMDETDTIRNNIDINTAEKSFLDRKVSEQGIYRKPGEYASGTVRIFGYKGGVISYGMKVASDKLLFRINDSAVIDESGFADVSAGCISTGAAGNVGAGEIYRFPVTLPDLTGVTNISAFSGGVDEEDDDSLRKRYIDKVSNPSACGTVQWYVNVAMAAGAGKVYPIPTWDGAGTLKLIITDENIKPPSAELIEKVSAEIDKERIIGAVVTVEGAKAQNISVTAKVKGSTDTSIVRSELEAEITKYLKTAEYISYAHIGMLILCIDGVEDYSDYYLNGGQSNIEISDGYVPVLGEVVVS